MFDKEKMQKENKTHSKQSDTNGSNTTALHSHIQLMGAPVTFESQYFIDIVVHVNVNVNIDRQIAGFSI